MLKIFFIAFASSSRNVELSSLLSKLWMRLLQSREGSLVDNTHNGATDLPGVLLLVATLGETTIK